MKSIKIASYVSWITDEVNFIEVVKADGGYYLLDYWGDKSHRYNNLVEAKLDVKDVYGKLKEFKLLERA